MIVRLAGLLFEPYQRPMFFTVEDDISWAAFVIAAAALRATDGTRLDYLNRWDKRHDLYRDIATDKYSIFRVLFL